MGKINEIDLLMTPCSDKEHLNAWIKKYCGLELPNKTVSRFSNCNPLDFIWKIYTAVMKGESLAALALSGRESFKTLTLSVIDLLAILHDQRHVIHLSMTKAQASRARAYLEKFILKNPILSDSVVKNNVTEIRMKVGSEIVGIEILPCTPKSVQGSHTSFLTYDELASSMEPNNLKGYKDSHGILGTSPKGKPAVVVKITSRQQGFSLAERELKDAPRSGLIVYKWTSLDATQRCGEERSGAESFPLWVDVLKDKSYTDAEYKTLPEDKKQGLEYAKDTMVNCRKCALCNFCLGELRNQTSAAPLLRTIEDTSNKIRLSGSWDWSAAQIMSLKPSSEGLVYFEFDRQIHVPGWNEMWRVLTGKESFIPVTRDMFIEELKRRDATFYAGCDWGWSSPSVCVVMAVDSREICYVVDTIHKTYTPDPEFIELIRTTVHARYDIQMYCPDLANGSGNALLRQAGLPTTDDIDKNINLGINLVKGLLRVPGTNRMPRVYFAPDLESRIPGVAGIIEEMELYHKKIDVTGKIQDDDNPEDEFNHALDSLRYMVYWLFGRMRMKSGADYERTLQATPKSNIPSLDEISRKHGIQYIDNRDAPPQAAEQEISSGTALWSWT